MKKHAKLLCAILVIATLCASLLFTVTAEEAEPFKESFKITDFGGNNITGGGNAKSDVDGNRVTGVSTMNPANSPFISVAQGEAENPYVVVYANQTYSGKPSSNNNIAINASTSNSQPFTVVGEGAKGYYVIDFDVATHGNLLPGFDVSVVMRRASDTSGFPFSDEIFVGNYITERDSWSHVTLVGDIKNNVVMVFINGQHVGDAGLAVRNDTSDSNKLANDTQVVAQGYRIEFTRNNQPVGVTKGDQACFDNFAHRLFINNGDDLTAALEDGNITDWSGYTAGRGEEPLPVVATVDGVEYRNFSKLANAFSTNDTVDVEFLAQPLVPMPICVNANINTNGMAQDKLFTTHSGCTITGVDGNVVHTSAPFVSNAGEEYIVTSDALSTLKYSHSKNILSHFTASNHGVSGGRAMYKVIDKYTGVTYINERVYSGTVTNSSDTYNGWFPSGGKIPYVTGTDQHIVIDFDVAMHTNDTYVFKTITRTSSMGSAWGTNDVTLNSIYSGNNLDTFIHVTMVFTTDTKDLTVFVNGTYQQTVNDIITDTSNHVFESLRTGGNSSASVSFANICMREVRSGVLTSAVNSQNISTWSDNIYTSDYRLPTPPTIVAVDGVGYYNEAELESALFGNKQQPAVVKVLHAFDNNITVNCDAVIYTYGQSVNFVDSKGNALTPDKNGIIRVDVPYIQVRSEQSVSDNQAIYKAIKSGIGGNLFTSVLHSAGNWGAAGYRNSSLITNVESGDVIYRNSAILNADGTVNADSSEYVDMKFTSTFTYSIGKNAYVVVDFDFATDGALTDDVYAVLVPGTGASVTSNGLVLNALGILDGDMAHVTVVYDLTDNRAYAFVNGLYACSVEGGVVSSNTNYFVGEAITFDSFRFATAGKRSSVCVDNVAIRTYSCDTLSDTIGASVDAGNITNWSDSIYTPDYKIAKLPTLAIVDGREYGSLDTLNKVLEISTNYIKNVELKYVPSAPVKIRSEVTIETHGLDVELDWNTGLYEFDPGVERYKGTRTGLAYASTKFIYTTVGTSYTFRVINAENCQSNATAVIWAYKISRGVEVKITDYDIVFYPYGEKMEPINDGKYLENGQYHQLAWKEVVITGPNSFNRVDVTEYPVAGPSVGTKIYTSSTPAQNVGYAASDMLYSANISTDIEFVFYVRKQYTAPDNNEVMMLTETGETAVIDGKEYVVFRFKLAPHEIDKIITVTFEIRYGGTNYTQKQNICFVDYARQLLEGDLVDKSLVVSLLDYANKAHVLFEKATQAEMPVDDNDAKYEMASVSALIEQYKEYLPNETLTEKLDTSGLRSVIRSAALRLNSTPEFVFKVARGFIGDITFSYMSQGVLVERNVHVNALSSEQNITIDGLNVADIATDITITVTPQGSETSMVGQYNLATYVQGLADNDFAVALYNYAKLAQKYQNVDTTVPV